MVKYKIETLMNYVNGDDIADYDIDVLENDYHFMVDVINYTNDKRIYNLCSNRLKANYRFIKFLIKKFYNDLEFVCDIADRYLELELEETKRFEIAIIMCNLVKNRTDKYKILAAIIYSMNKMEIDLFKVNASLELRNDIGMGFIYILEKFSNSDIIIRYFAEHFLNSINLEKQIHKQFMNVQQLEQINISNYLIECLNHYDYYLANYVINHADIFNNLKLNIQKIKDNWENYEINRYELILEQIHEYIVNNDCLLDEIFAICYASFELGVGDQIRRYTDISNAIYSEMINNEFARFYLSDFTYLKSYHDVKKLMKNLLKD